MFSISSQSYEILYHPNEAMIGRDALSSGISVSDLEDGNFSWMTLNGKRFYAGVTELDRVYYIAAVPEAEIEGARNPTVGIILFIFFAVMTIVITYGVLVMYDYEKKGDQGLAYVKLGRLGYNKVVGGKTVSLSVVGLLFLLVVTYYMQTLFALSNQSISNHQRVNDVEETILRYESQEETLREQYNDWYLSKCQTAAYIIENNPSLAERETLKLLADTLQVTNIYVFDQTGTVTATSSTYDRFQVSQEEGDQSYEINKLLAGGDYLIQEAQPDEASGEFYQYIGVSMHNAEGSVDGFVQIAIRPERLENILENMQISNVLDSVQVGGNGFAFAVNKEDSTFVYYPQTRLIGKKATDYGILEKQLKDGYTDYLTIQSQRYYCASVDTGDTLVYVAVPEEDIMSERIPLTLTCGGICLVSLILIYLFLSFDGYRNALIVESAEEAGKDGKRKRMIDVVMPDGRVKKTESASSRWMFMGMSWSEKTPEQQIATVVRTLFGILAIVVCAIILFREKLLGEDSIFGYVISGKWELGLNIFSITASIMIICVVMTATTLLKKLLRLLSRAFSARGETVCRLIASFVKYVSIIVMAYYCFGLFGVDTATLLASAGILSIAISLGAKDLVSDLLSGLFIIFEGEFRVGDIVMIGDWRGTVLEIGVRTTKIEDASQNIKIIRNSNVTGVINMTKHKSYAACDVGIEYGESLERVESIFEEEFPNIRAHLPAIQDGPFYKGVVSLGDNSVNVRIVVQCNETDRAQLERDLNREMKLLFDKHNINIPFPQVVINKPIEFQKATVRQKIRAQIFNEEQRESAKELGNDEDEPR